MGVSGTNTGHSGTDCRDKGGGGGGVSGTRYCEKCACVAHGWMHLTGRRRR